MDRASSKESNLVKIIEGAETRLRLLIKQDYLRGISRRGVAIGVERIIRETLSRIKNASLRGAAYASLNAFATRQYRTYITQLGYGSAYLLAISQLYNTNKITPQMLNKLPKVVIAKIETNAKGVPLDMYAKEYMEKKVAPIFERLASQTPLDPGDTSGRNSLRNRAEMEVRYQAHQDTIADFKSKGIKLVTTNVYADCSKRCVPYQGKVYSLDGSSGTTDDGRKFEPLEVATDIFYTTKAGKTYKNGLLGFNCRHKLIAYLPGMATEFVSEKTRRKQYAIDEEQRRLETKIRYWRNRKLYSTDIDERFADRAAQKVDKWTDIYKKFSTDNHVAIYIDRTKTM